MKLTDLFETKESKLEQALKSIRAQYQSNKDAFTSEGFKRLEQIIDTLLASATDESTFSRYYNKFLAEHPDAMDHLLEDLYAEFGVTDADDFFKKAFKH